MRPATRTAMRTARRGWLWLALAGALLLASACGGGGGSSSSAPPAPTDTRVAGVAQKGPFRQGAMLVATPLDARGARTGAPMRTTIRSDRGDYELVFPAGSLPAGASILLEATGQFYNEWTGELSQGSLRAVVPADASNASWNINLLTHLAADDIIANLQGGMQAREALRIAQEDLAMELAQLGALIQGPLSLHELDLVGDADDDLDLLLLSMLFLEHDKADETRDLMTTLTALQNDITPLVTTLQTFCDEDKLISGAIRLALDEALADATATAQLFQSLPTHSVPATIPAREGLLAALKELPDLKEASNEVKTACATLGPAATFRVEFRGQWSSTNHMGAFPTSNKYGIPHFTTLIGATHSTVVHLWEAGQLATSGMESVAEVGGTSTITQEINAHRTAGNVGRLVRASIASGGTASTSFTFQTTKAHPLLSLASMVAPSPDWFVGLDSFSLLESGDWISSKTVMLFAYDAGTEEGNEFKLANDASNPHMPIARITTAPLGTQTKPLAVITITRTSPSP